MCPCIYGIHSKYVIQSVERAIYSAAVLSLFLTVALEAIIILECTGSIFTKFSGRFLTNKLVYLGYDARYGHSCLEVE